jgi:hypothetical protein
MSMFQKATKKSVKARVGLEGPTGAGKSFTALQCGTALGERVAVIDTERGSASLYSDRFDFDVLEMAPPYEPQRLIEALEAAEKEGYDVVIVDSLSHFWEGEGGTLDIADAATQRSGGGNSFAGWKVATPALRHLIDTMLGLDAHLIVTMRSKMEYVLEEDSRGKKVPRKVGLAPVMRNGVEYEFQIIGDLDLEHRLTISKSRCEALADQVFQPGRAVEMAQTFKQWLDTGEPAATRNDTDALVSRMNRLPDVIRTATKEEFVKRFGRPTGLLESKLADAQQFVADAEAQVSAASTEAEHEPAGDDRIDKLRGHFFALCAQANVDTKGDDGRKRYHALLKHATGGAYESTTQLTREDMDTKVKPVLTDVMEGRLELHLRANGSYEVRPVRLRSVKEKAGA